MQTDWSCFETMWSRLALHLFLLLLLTYFQALTLIGPRLANTGEPREKERTAALAKNAPIKTFMMGCLFFSAALDKVVNPSLRLPARKDFAAEPALVCVKRAKAAPVSITLIPNWREGFLLARARRLTMTLLG